jgi:hypothetical protein
MRTCSILFFLAAVLLAWSARAHAAGIPTIRLTASRQAVLNDGRDSTEIIAEVRDSTGSYFPDGTTVTFTTNLGVFMQAGTTGTSSTRAGTARIRLTSQQKGTALVQAVTIGGGFASIEISFTDDPAEMFQGNAYVSVQATGSLLYSAGHRVIEATGKARKEGDAGLSGAYMSYRNLTVTADALQVECTSNTVRASGNVTLRKGVKSLACERLYFPLMTGDGYAIAEKDGRLRPVKVKSGDLSTELVENGVAPRFFEMTDLSDAPLIIAARQILLFPNEKLQFKRPRFFQEGQQLFSMPFYSLGLYSTELFSDQILSVGTQGLGVDVPFYYDMTPVSTGVFRILNGERSGRSVYATRPGWSLDLDQSYNSLGAGPRYTGDFGFTGMNRSDWGFHWSHSQEFSQEMRGSFFLDMPQHRSMFLSSNLNRQLGMFYMGMNLSANRSLSGPATTGSEADLYLETIPRKVGRTGYMMAFGGTATVSHNVAGDIRSNYMTQGVQTRFFSSPFRLDKHTTLTNYLTVGQLWTNSGQSGSTINASLSARRTFWNGANLQLTYDFTRQPYLLTQGGSHRVSMNFVASGGGKWNLFLYGSTLLDAANSSLIGDFNYVIAPRWRLSLSATLQRFATASYRDFEFSLGRSVGGRDLALTYSTFNHRFFFDIEASRF